MSVLNLRGPENGVPGRWSSRRTHESSPFRHGLETATWVDDGKTWTSPWDLHYHLKHV
ncbi:MAG TPA: hypothetical protein VH163_10030 [Gemmatimonadales bacterium]|nr:hypothetical protein [Gemmatimonadales bacterium]